MSDTKSASGKIAVPSVAMAKAQLAPAAPQRPFCDHHHASMSAGDYVGEGLLAAICAGTGRQAWAGVSPWVLPGARILDEWV